MKIISAFFFLFFKVALPQTTKEPVSEVSQMMGGSAFLLLSANISLGSRLTFFSPWAVFRPRLLK